MSASDEFIEKVVAIVQQAEAEGIARFTHAETTRSYTVGLPVTIYVNDEGTVHYEVDTSEASSAMNDDWVSFGKDDARDQLAADMDRVDADHDKRNQPSI
jgi:hypothetical protein